VEPGATFLHPWLATVNLETTPEVIVAPVTFRRAVWPLWTTVIICPPAMVATVMSWPGRAPEKRAASASGAVDVRSALTVAMLPEITKPEETSR